VYVRRRHFFHLREGKFMRMTQRPIRCFSLLAIVMLALPALAGDGRSERACIVDLEPAVAEAWRNAGAEVSWIWRVPGGMRFTDQRPDEPLPFPVPRRFRKPDFRVNLPALPGFRLDRWPANGIADLPAPATPFALLCSARLSKMQLHELANFKQLRMFSSHENTLTIERSSCWPSYTSCVTLI